MKNRGLQSISLDLICFVKRLRWGSKINNNGICIVQVLIYTCSVMLVNQFVKVYNFDTVGTTIIMLITQATDFKWL